MIARVTRTSLLAMVLATGVAAMERIPADSPLRRQPRMLDAPGPLIRAELLGKPQGRVFLGYTKHILHLPDRHTLAIVSFSNAASNWLFLIDARDLSSQRFDIPHHDIGSQGLAMGADRGILIRSDRYLDPINTARSLQAAIQRDGNPDIIFTGKESIDSEGFQTMHRLGAAFDMPVVSNVVMLSLDDGMVQVECEMESGDRQIINISLPCIIGAAKGLNEPTYPTLPAILKARKKEVHYVELSDLNIEPPESGVEILKLEPAIEKRQPKKIVGSPDEMADKIVRILREEAKVI